MVTQPIAFEHFEEALRSKEEVVCAKGEVMRLYEQYILNAWEDKSSWDGKSTNSSGTTSYATGMTKESNSKVGN
ncbi:hypothetical protein TVAG_127360 [Trichomonas vaginalis G3]|uniref:Uncharacterized protein n=1 Tax=Trichomonas vaginalis (strain ATCC PRA-98 / G3) TaxID=412133 RepID=A2E803_TRIV3|nr:hypothetical protein TVAG_127360 [Trichomonas vaginalis G3]|eukprot:XP_001323452.1 hypothetical protein [Trichomonas vaginalis G3]